MTSSAPLPRREVGTIDHLADPELLAQVCARRPEALERFFDDAFPFVYAIALRMTGDRTTAEDVTQDALHRIHRGIESLDPARPARPWIATITANLARDHLRRVGRGRERTVDPRDSDGMRDARRAHPEGPEEGAIRKERTALLERAIADLPEDLRMVLVLRTEGDRSYEEIAEALRIQPAAARKRYSRALAAVRETVRRSEA